MPRRRVFVNPEAVDELLGSVDIVFVVDTTGSMRPFLEEAKKYIREQAVEIATNGKLTPRYGVIQYRDHPPQDSAFVTRSSGFVDDSRFQWYLRTLQAEGGGDRDEAVYDGVLNLSVKDWRPGADRVAFLVGDSPPHNPCLCGLLTLRGRRGLPGNHAQCDLNRR